MTDDILAYIRRVLIGGATFASMDAANDLAPGTLHSAYIVKVRDAKHRRPRGPIRRWKPTRSTQDLVADMIDRLNAEREYWPLSVRAVYYRLLGTGRHAKGKHLSARVSEHLGNARRAGVIPWEAISDPSAIVSKPRNVWANADEFVEKVRAQAKTIRLDRQAGQRVRLAIWCEARGVLHVVQSVAHEYGVPVYSGGGYDSTTLRHDIGVGLDPAQPTIVLHIGDFDPDGEGVFHAVSEDVLLWAAENGAHVEFVRLAVTAAQVDEYDLPDDPDKPGTVQAEAFSGAQLVALVRDAITDRQDAHVRATVLADEQAMQADASTALGNDGGED